VLMLKADDGVVRIADDDHFAWHLGVAAITRQREPAGLPA
jgi:hypothetical protein